MAENTPESDLGSIECFQNYTAPEVFIQGLAGTVDQQDVECIIRAQKQMLQRFEKTNEMLSNCNTLCVSRLKLASVEFKKHTNLLGEMRKDLDNIFKRIHTLKAKINTHYPEALNKHLERLSCSEGSADPTQPNTVVSEPSDDDEPQGVKIAKSANSSSSESLTQHGSSPNTSDSN